MQLQLRSFSYHKRVILPGFRPTATCVRAMPPGSVPDSVSAAMSTGTETKKPLVVVGSVNADLVLKVERVPKPGETLGASSLEFFPGGKGGNQAAAAAKLGYPTYFLGQIGTDANAAVLRQALASCGVDLSHLTEVPGPSGTAVILLQPSGENSIIIVGGANQAPWQLSGAARRLVQSAGAVLLQREVPDAVNAEVAALARSAGVPVVLDAGGVEAPVSIELLRHVTLLSPNETELARLSGCPTADLEQAQAAASVLQQQGVSTVLVKLGSNGSLLIPDQGQPPLRHAAFKVAKVVDTTGAGDCFTAAFAVAMLEGRPHAQALRFASAAAALCVQQPGAMPSLPVREAVEQLLEQDLQASAALG